jgi:hypothetical protein
MPSLAASQVPPASDMSPIGKIDPPIRCQPNQNLAADQPEEPGCLVQFSDRVTRQGDDLTFKLDNGKTKLITSNPKACDDAPVDACVIYQLVGYVRQSRQFVLRVLYYESEFVHLVSQSTGAVTELEGYPHPSPGGRRFVTVAASDAWDIKSPIAVYANVEPPRLDWRFPEPTEYEQYAFDGWDGEDRMKLHTISNPAIETDLKRTERIWILRRPNGKVSSGTSLPSPPPPPPLAPEAALSKEAAEAWSAVRQTRNPLVLLEFIKRYRTTSLVEPAQARLKEIASPWPAVTAPPPTAISDSTPATGAKDGAPQGAAAKSEAAEAWDAIKDTTNPALLEAFITRYATTFFAEIAKARLDELKAKIATPSPPATAQPFPDVAPKPVQTLTIPTTPEPPTDGIHQRAVLYEEEPGNSTGRQFAGTVVWRSETIKAEGRPDEVAIRADVEIPSRSLRLTMTLRRNLDPGLSATHVIDLTSHFDNGGIENIPGMLMKANERARGMPLAGLSVKVADGLFMLGLSSVPNDRVRNLSLLVERAWFDIPMTYTNHRRAILAIDKGETGERVFKTILSVWGQYPVVTGPAASAPARDR